MKYIFEDNEESDIAVLFRKVYSKNMINNFTYTNGNGNLLKVAKDITDKETEETIIIYMDMIPGNKSCIRIYGDLLNLSKKHSNNIIVLPIVCAEYYMIKSLEHTNVFNTTEYERCINKIPHLASPLMNRADVQRFCKNFEKYCKWILKYDASKDCIKPFNKETGNNGEYYRVDCIDTKDRCNSNKYINYTCNNKDIQSKSYELLKAYQYTLVK